MVIHYTFFMMALIPSIIFSFGIYFRHNVFEKSAFFILLIITSLQYNVGGDYSNYYIMFNQAKNDNFFYFNYSEPLFLLLNKLIISLHLPFNSILLIINSFFYYNIYNIFIKVKKNYRFFLFFLFMFSFDAYWSNLIYLRQEIAMTFFLIAIKYIQKKSFIKYFITIFIGSLFHNILILFLPLYFLKNISIIKLISIFIAISIGVYFTNYVINLFGFKQYLYYLRQEQNLEFNIGFSVKIFVFMVGLYMYKYIKNFYFTLFIIGQFISIIKIFMPLLFRIELFFIIFHIYGLYLIIKQIDKRHNKYFTTILVLLILTYNVLSLNNAILNKRDYYFWDRYKLILLEDNNLEGVTNKWKYREHL